MRRRYTPEEINKITAILLEGIKQKKTNLDIAKKLNERGMKTASGAKFKAQDVGNVIYRQGLRKTERRRRKRKVRKTAPTPQTRKPVTEAAAVDEAVLEFVRAYLKGKSIKDKLAVISLFV